MSDNINDETFHHFRLVCAPRDGGYKNHYPLSSLSARIQNIASSPLPFCLGQGRSGVIHICLGSLNLISILCQVTWDLDLGLGMGNDKKVPLVKMS